MRRPVAKLLEDIQDAIEVGNEIVRTSRSRYDQDPVVRYAAEAVIGHIGDAATKLPSETREVMPEVPWQAVIGARIMVDHVYHRLDLGRIWTTLEEDLPVLQAAIERYRAEQ